MRFLSRWRQSAARLLTAVSTAGGGWFNIVREAFAGAWQGNVTVDGPRQVVAYSAVFACLALISNDIAKMRVRIMELTEDRIGEEVAEDIAVLRRPNHYQNRIQFWAHWIMSKLLFGNTYVLKERGGRGAVIGLYVLDPQKVTVLVAETGDVYYKLSRDDLSGVQEVTVPAREIIHDRMNCIFHPLIGMSPIFACSLSATMGNRIQKNSTKFFDNMSRPSGTLTAPGEINKETADRMKEDWNDNFGGDKIGKVAILGSGLKYEAMAIPAGEAQLIDQLRWTAEDVARCFAVPFYKIGGPVPANTSVDVLDQGYYSSCLQSLIESAELGLDEGLELKDNRYSEFDLDALIRMDSAKLYEANTKGVSGGWLAPNEARRKVDLKPVPGGETPYLQQQNYSLKSLGKRDAKSDPFETSKTASQESADEDWAEQMTSEFVRKMMEVTTPEAAPSEGLMAAGNAFVAQLAQHAGAGAAEALAARAESVRVADSMNALSEVLSMDVVPVYGPDGRIIRTHRVPKEVS